MEYLNTYSVMSRKPHTYLSNLVPSLSTISTTCFIAILTGPVLRTHGKVLEDMFVF